MPRLGLSIRQPWAWLIVNGFKDIENRDWHGGCSFRGPFFIHTGKTMKRDEYEEARAFALPLMGDRAGEFPAFEALPLGGVVGIANMVDCVEAHASPWFMGQRCGLVLAEARPVPFFACGGQLGIFRVKYPEELWRALP
jgi:hypothetical protein